MFLLTYFSSQKYTGTKIKNGFKIIKEVVSRNALFNAHLQIKV